MQNWFRYLKGGLTRQLPADKLASDTGARPRLDNLRPFVLRQWRKGLAGVGLILFVSLLQFPQPLAYRFLVDDVMLARRLDLLALALLILGGIKLAAMAATLVQQYFFKRFEQQVLLDLQQNLIDHALRLPKSFFDNKEVGYLLSRLSADVQGLRWFFSGDVVFLISSVFRFVGGVILLFYLEWRLGIVTVIVLPVLVVLTRYFGQRLYALSHHSMERSAGVLQRIEETLASLPLIKAFASETRESRRVISEVEANQQVEMEQVTVGSAAGLVMSVVPGVASVVTLVTGAYWVIQGQWTLGSLLAFQAYLGYVFGPAISLANANLQFQTARTALERVSAILDLLPEGAQDQGRIVARLKGDIRFENVSFAYDGQDMVLEDVSFSIQPGEHVAIVGPSGVGKTTLVSLMLCFYRPTRGEIFFDAVPARECEQKSLRQRIGYVSQATILLSGTIRENLQYGNPQASQESIERAARAAGIHDFIKGLEFGYDSLVGERGVNFSEGQKQRLSIARALVKDPDILLMDEPTSSLDGIVEQSIFEALPELVRNKTLVVVAHRPATIRKADRVMLFGEKKLSAVGHHEALLETNEYYRSVFK